MSKENGNIRIKIGDPDTTITGEHTYVIGYTVQRGINFFEKHDEIYWNATGNEWNVPIHQAKAIVRLSRKDEHMKIYKHLVLPDMNMNKPQIVLLMFDNAKAVFITVDDKIQGPDLKSYQGFTVVMGLPKGYFMPATTWQEIRWFIQDNGVLFIPLLVFFSLYYRWYRYGRDPQRHKSNAPMYSEPEGLTAAEVGVIVDERTDTKDISGSLIQTGCERIYKDKRGTKRKDTETKGLSFHTA